EDESALLGLRLQDLEDQVLLAHPGRAGDRQVLGDRGQLLDALVLEIGDVQARQRRLGGWRRLLRLLRLWRRGAVGRRRRGRRWCRVALGGGGLRGRRGFGFRAFGARLRAGRPSSWIWHGKY